MIVPWTGFPLSLLLNKVQPKPEAKFVRFETFNLPKLAPGIQKYGYYPWPYVEGLRLDEAMCPLSLLTFGISENLFLHRTARLSAWSFPGNTDTKASNPSLK